jgi:hypothetical protein
MSFILGFELLYQFIVSLPIRQGRMIGNGSFPVSKRHRICGAFEDWFAGPGEKSVILAKPYTEEICEFPHTDFGDSCRCLRSRSQLSRAFVHWRWIVIHELCWH